MAKDLGMSCGIFLLPHPFVVPHVLSVVVAIVTELYRLVFYVI